MLPNSSLGLFGYWEEPLTGDRTREGEMESDRDRAIEAAYRLYEEYKKLGVDFSEGPCLGQEVITDWCVDIAHEPRQPVDNLAQNQCESFRQGRVRHFVELDPDGNLLRAV